jgi:hypothetical protein
MGFKLNYTLLAGSDAGSFNGTNTLGVPFNAQVGITDASTLMDDIGSTAVINIQRYIESSNGIDLYPGVNFAITPGEGYFVRMSSNKNYIVVGSNDPTLYIDHDDSGEADSFNGTNFVSYAYHSTSVDASALMDEIGSTAVINIQRYVVSNNGIDVYPGTNFSMKPGEAYFVRMSSTTPWTPSHY